MIRFLTLLIAALLLGSVSAADRPNILWLTSEDLGPHLGCYGDAYADTPNLDAFAKRSQLFLRAWSNAPVCAPARTVIISGMHATSTGGEHMRSMVPMPQGTKMYAELLREAGYYCTNNVKEDYNLEKSPQTWDESSAKAHWKKRRPGQPFFAIFNFMTTHESQIRRPGHTLVHDPAKAPLPPYHPDTPEVRHDWAQYADNITAMDGQFAEKLKELEDAGLAEDTIVFFYGDHGAGMPRHKRWPYDSGLRVPFIVHFPAKWKHLAPKGYAPGAKSEELVSFVDLAPTLLSLIGQPAPDWMQGRAFAGAHAKAAPQFLFGYRGRMDERIDMVRSVTDGRFTYVRHYLPHLPYAQHVSYMFQMPTARVWRQLAAEGKLNEVQRRFWEPKPVEELYDLQADPFETRNLAGSGEHEQDLARLRRAHLEHLTAIRDLGFIPEAERVGIAGDRSPRDVFADDKLYPLAQVIDLAQRATLTGNADPAPFIEALGNKNAILRWWGVLGLHLRGSAAVTPSREALLKLLKDESPSVRIVAATALAQHGTPEDLAPALELLITLADAQNFGAATATEALNAITNLGDKAAPLKEKLAELPRKGRSGPPRLQEYPNRLLTHLLGGKEEE